MKTLATAVLIHDASWAPDGRLPDGALSAWIAALVDVGVLDVRLVIAEPESLPASSLASLPLRGVCWITQGSLELDVAQTELVIIGCLEACPSFELAAAVLLHRQSQTECTSITASSGLKEPGHWGPITGWFAGGGLAGSQLILIQPDAYREALAGINPIPIVERQMPGLRPGAGANVPAGKRPAVFLDRDGTIIEDAHFLSDPAKIRFFPGSASAIGQLREAGYLCVVVSNQSGVGRGMFSETTMWEVHREFLIQLTRAGGALDGAYYCPLGPSRDHDTETSDRKPGAGMLLRAAGDLGIDLAASWMVGDSARDLVAGTRAGCRDCLFMDNGKEQSPADRLTCDAYRAVATLEEAAAVILSADAGHAPARSNH